MLLWMNAQMAMIVYNNIQGHNEAIETENYILNIVPV